MPLRVLFDTNLYISFLLNPQPASLSSVLMQRALEGAFILLLPKGVVSEMARTIARQPYLNKRINAIDAQRILFQIEEAAEIIDISSKEVQRIVRDPNDDFLIASAIEGDADYVVTWDKDLLILDGHIGSLSIVTPTRFLTELGSAGNQ